MIRYALACDDGHRFESWFRDSAAFDEQHGHRRLACPTCGSTHVAKSIMAPAVVSPMRSGAPKQEGADIARALGEGGDRRETIRRLRAHIFSHGDDVGAAFVAEARRIHEGEAPDRQIFGQASVVEARELLDEGIVVLPLPDDPDALN